MNPSQPNQPLLARIRPGAKACAKDYRFWVSLLVCAVTGQWVYLAYLQSIERPYLPMWMTLLPPLWFLGVGVAVLVYHVRSIIRGERLVLTPKEIGIRFLVGLLMLAFIRGIVWYSKRDWPTF